MKCLALNSKQQLRITARLPAKHAQGQKQNHAHLLYNLQVRASPGQPRAAPLRSPELDKTEERCASASRRDELAQTQTRVTKHSRLRGHGGLRLHYWTSEITSLLIESTRCEYWLPAGQTDPCQAIPPAAAEASSAPFGSTPGGLWTRG